VRTALIALAAAGTMVAAGCADRTGTNPAAGPTTSGGVATETTVTATGTATPTATTPPGGTSSPPAPASGTRCHTGDLAAALREGDAAAGNRYATLVLTNTSRRICTVFGYGGLQLADARRQPIPTVQQRDPAHPPSLIRLDPGRRASTRLHWSAVPHTGEAMTGPCEPTPALLLVIPPDERTQLAVRWTSGPVCGHGAIEEWAYAPGIVAT
jgi:hypothetical protein